MPTMNEFKTENTLGTPSRENRSAKKEDVMKNLEGIINSVAQKASENKNAVETVKNTNS